MAIGCARQGEGERCDFIRNGHDDCEPEFVCVVKDELVASGVDRCCPPEGQSISDDLCRRKTGGGTGGTGGAGGAAGGAAGSGGAAGGAAGSGGAAGASGGAGGSGTGGADAGVECTYDSQCPGSQVCGPLGRCQSECLGDKDCPKGETCDVTAGVCLGPDAG